MAWTNNDFSLNKNLKKLWLPIGTFTKLSKYVTEADKLRNSIID